MQTLDSEFVEHRRRAGVLSIALAACGICAIVWTVTGYQRAAQQRDAWETKLHDIRKMSRRVPSAMAEPARDSRESQQEVRLANTVLRQMAVPWDTLFREIEIKTSESVALLSVQPDAQNRLIRIAGEAKNLEVLLDYVRGLGTTRALTNIFLTSHEVKAQDAQRPVSFSLVAAWSEKR